MLKQKLFFVGILKVNEEKGRIRIHLSEAWIRGIMYRKTFFSMHYLRAGAAE